MLWEATKWQTSQKFYQGDLEKQATKVSPVKITNTSHGPEDYVRV